MMVCIYSGLENLHDGFYFTMFAINPFFRESKPILNAVFFLFSLQDVRIFMSH